MIKTINIDPSNEIIDTMNFIVVRVEHFFGSSGKIAQVGNEGGML